MGPLGKTKQESIEQVELVSWMEKKPATSDRRIPEEAQEITLITYSDQEAFNWQEVNRRLTTSSGEKPTRNTLKYFFPSTSASLDQTRATQPRSYTNSYGTCSAIFWSIFGSWRKKNEVRMARGRADGSEFQNMHIFASIKSPSSVDRYEYAVCTLRYFNDGTLLMRPGFSKNMNEPYLIKTIDGRAFEFYLENASEL